jgi:cytochrome c-type biogenesis protein CcmH/NrfG
MNPNNTIQKQTLYISIVVSLLIGFLTGIVFSDRGSGDANAYSTPADPANRAAGQIASLELEVAANPGNTAAWTQLGNHYFDSDQYQKAVNAYTRSLELSPGNPDVMTDLGIMYRSIGQPEKAVQIFMEAAEIDPRHEQSRFNTGIVMLYDLNDPAEAIAAWQGLLRINPLASVSDGRTLQEIVNELQQTTRQQRKE